MQQSIPATSRLQVQLKTRLAWLGFFLLIGVSKLYDYASGGKISALLSGSGFVLIGLSSFLAPAISAFSLSSRANEKAAIGPTWLHQLLTVVSVGAIGVSLYLRFAHDL